MLKTIAIACALTSGACSALIDGAPSDQDSNDLAHRHHPDARQATPDAAQKTVDARIVEPDAAVHLADAHQAIDAAVHVVDAHEAIDAAVNTGGGSGGSLAPVTGLQKVGTGEYRAYYLVSGKIYGLGDLNGSLAGNSLGIPLPLNAPAGTTFIDVQSGLHESLAVDSNGNVYGWGMNDQGQVGNGTQTGDGTDSINALVVSYPTKITQDIDGNAFTGVTHVYCHMGESLAVKSDGTVWFWGDGSAYLAGSATNLGAITRPTQVVLPAGVKITQLSVSYIALALATDGSVYSWGNFGAYGNNVNLGTGTDSATPKKITALPTGIVEVTSGTTFNYALTSAGVVWGWGTSGNNLGFSDGRSVNTPQALTSVLNLRAPVKTIVVNDETTHAVLTDGSLWGWGAEGQGEVGNGVEYNFALPAYGPYSIWGGTDLMQYSPVQIEPTVNNFSTIYASSDDGFYIYAATADNHLYFMGRNKNGISGSGIIPGAASGNPYAATDILSAYPCSWNVPTPQEVSPMALTQATPTLSPYCIANPNTSPCDEQ